MERRRARDLLHSQVQPFQMKNEAEAYDAVGHSTLEKLAEANNFNTWMSRHVAAHCSGRILEIGSGIGNISRWFIENGADITLSDCDARYRDILRNNPLTKKCAVLDIDLVNPAFESEYAACLSSFDSVFALNVIEHIEDDGLALQNLIRLLKPGGTLIILVPAYQSLFCRLDKNLGHYRRYNRKSLRHLLSKVPLVIKQMRAFNLAGILGWWFAGKVMKKETLPAGSLKLYNALVPVFQVMDGATFTTVGLSIIAVAEKPAAT